MSYNTYEKNTSASDQRPEIRSRNSSLSKQICEFLVFLDMKTMHIGL